MPARTPTTTCGGGPTASASGMGRAGMCLPTSTMTAAATPSGMRIRSKGCWECELDRRLVIHQREDLKMSVTEALRAKVREELPEVEEIGDPELRQKVVEVWALALARSSFGPIAA